MAQFSDSFSMLIAGATYNIGGIGLASINLNPIFGLAGNETLIIGNNFGARIIDLGGGTDAVTLSTSGGYTLNLANVETVNGTAGNENLTMAAAINGTTFSLGAGTNDNINLANGANSIGVVGVENAFGTDFNGPASNDTLTMLNGGNGVNINLGQGTNTLNLAAGASSFLGLHNIKFLNGTASDDDVTITNGIFVADNNPVIDLGGGSGDVLRLGSQGFNGSLSNVEQLVGNAFDNFFSLTTTVDGIAVDLVSGNDTLVLANGFNRLSALNIDQINGSDFGGSSSDTLTLMNNVTGLGVNLAGGTNTLNLASGANTLGNLNDVHAVNGTSSADTLTIIGGVSASGGGTTVDLGDDTDSLTLASAASNLTVVDVENVTGSAMNDTIIIGNTTGATIVTGGGSVDFLTASIAQDTFRFTNVTDSTVNGVRDQVTDFDAANDMFMFDGIGGPNGFDGQITFLEVGSFSGTGGPEAMLSNGSIQIDVDGDGVMTANDMEIQLNNLQGTLGSSNFFVV
jgi:hypothetical protein